jgi:hypothetical protein
VQAFINLVFTGTDTYTPHSVALYTVLQDTTYFPSCTPGTQAIGAVLSNTNSTLPFFDPVKLMLALAFAELSPIPAPIVIVSGVMVKPLPRPKSLDPACNPPTPPVSRLEFEIRRGPYLHTRHPPSSLFRSLSRY